MLGWWPTAFRASEVVDEHHRVGEVLPHESLYELVAAPISTRQVQALLDRGVVRPVAWSS